MHFVILLSVLISSRCYALTYWIDPACSTADVDVDLSAAIGDAQATAAYAREALEWTPQQGAEESAYYDFYFRELFKETRLNNYQTSRILNIFYTHIAQLTPVPNGQRSESNIRIYCDNDRRFQGTALLDPLDGIQKVGEGCGAADIEGVTYTHVYQPGNQAWPRASITLCPITLAYEDTLEDYLGDLDYRAVMCKPVDEVGENIANVLFHEFTHCTGMGFEELWNTAHLIGGNQPEVYHWNPTQGLSLRGLTNQQAEVNAESYAKFALLCRAEEMGWRMHPTLVDQGYLVDTNERE